MTKSQVKNRLEKLRELVNDYRYHYHVLNQSLMSEAAADSLKHEISQLEAQFPDLVTADSPSQRVAGTVLPGFTQVEHSSRMLSLNDVFNEAELSAWQTRIAKMLTPDAKLKYFVDIKMDGFACALVYIDGIFSRAVTRGDGFAGEDVTSNVRTLESVPLRLRTCAEYDYLMRGRTEVRGEIVMYKADFTKLNQQRREAGQPQFANPRNTAAGTIRQLNPQLVANRPLHFRAYDLLTADPALVTSHDYAYKALASSGFLVNQAATVLSSLKQVMEFRQDWDKRRKELPFNTDGLVIKVNDRKDYARLGVAGKAPRGAVAFKYAAEQSTTIVKDIFISIGRTGVATPVAMLEPVVIAGSTVQMATLHNEAEVKRKDIRIGDTVIVHKAGDIIPEVVEALVKLRQGSEIPFKMPAICPECQTLLVKYNQKDAAWRCPFAACPSRSWKRIEHFASKSALDIAGLGEKNVIALLDAKLISDPADLYVLTPDDLRKLPRFGDLSANKLVQAIQAKKAPALNRFIYGLGIRHIGAQTAIDLANRFGSLEQLSSASISELSAVPGVGEIVAEAVTVWFNDPANLKLLTKFKRYHVQSSQLKIATGKLTGKNLVVTGHLDSMSRETAAEMIRKMGGTFQTAIGKNTDYFIVGLDAGNSKLAKAAKLGIKQIDELEFLKLLKP